jgi:hypothetical protein
VNDDAGAPGRPRDIDALHTVHLTCEVSTELSLKKLPDFAGVRHYAVFANTHVLIATALAIYS